MKKSVLAFSLILALLLSLSVSAFAAKAPAKAETEEVVELNWEEFEDALAERKLKGDFYVLNAVTAQFWVPNTLKQIELTDDEVETGITAYFGDETEDHGFEGYGFYVTYYDGKGQTLEDYAEMIEEDEAYTGLETLKINGLDAIGYYETDQERGIDFQYVTFVTDEGYILTFAYWDVADEDYMELAVIMISSIMPEEE